MRYSKEVKQFIAENAQGNRPADLAVMVNEKFGTEFTYPKMRAFLKNHKLRTGTPKGYGKQETTKLYPREVREYIRDNYIGCAGNEMAVKLNQIFGTDYTGKQIRSFYKNNKLNSGLTGCFEKGHESPTKGMKGIHFSPQTEFPKGHTPHNHLPVGTEIVHPDGYHYRKIQEPNIWRSVHRLIWEESNGEIPEGMKIVFLDRNPLNCSIENLCLVSSAELVRLNQNKLLFQDPDQTKTGIAIAQLITKTHKRKKEEVR